MAPLARIQWHEGMLLSPQHFQQESARVDTLVAWQTMAVHPYAWGVLNLQFDNALLAAGRLRVTQLEAILPDGTALVYPTEHALPLELDLAPFAQEMAHAELAIYLVLPVSGRMRDPGVPARFRSVVVAPLEDEVSEALPADVPRLLPALSLSAGQEPSGLYTSMRIASVYRDNELNKFGQVLAPLLEVPRQGELWERLSAFVTQLRGKAAFVAKQTAVPSSRTEDRLAYLEQRERLRNLVSSLAQIEAVIRSPRLHPYTLFLSLCTLLGPISLLKPGALPPVPPVYDHANPHVWLAPVLDALQAALEEVSQDYREFKFEFRHGAFEIALQAEWVTPRLIIGLRGQPERELVAWMQGAIIGTQSAYASLRERRVLGAERQFIEASNELGVRASAGFTLFAVQSSAELTVANELLVISNSTESASAQRPQEMVFFVKG